MPDSQTAAPVLCAVDYSAGSQAALVRAADLAERFHAPLLLLHVDPLFRTSVGAAPDPDAPGAVARERMRTFAAKALGGDAAVAVVDPEGVVRRGEYAGDAIVGQAQEVGARLVVVGTQGRRGLERLLSGSVAEDVARRAPCPVLVVPNAAARTAPHAGAPILVPVDFSVHAAEALDSAAQMAGFTGAPLSLLHVVGPALTVPTFYGDVLGAGLYDVPAIVGASEKRLREIADGLDADARVHTRVGTAHAEIVEAAQEQGAGLIVMATRGLAGFDHVLLGSVTERTLRKAPCPVLVVRGREAIVDP